MKRLLLLLGLIMMSTQSAWAYYTSIWFYFVNVKERTINNVTYQLCYTYDQVQKFHVSGAEPVVTFDYALEKTNEQYYASVIGVNLNSDGPIVIESAVTDGGITYPVKYVGMHTIQTEQTRETEVKWYEHRDNPDEILGYEIIEHNITLPIPQTKRYEYVGEPISNSHITSLTVKGALEFKGGFSAPSCQTAVFQKIVTISNDMLLPQATQVTFNGHTNITPNGYLQVSHCNELRFPSLHQQGVIDSQELTDIYFSNSDGSYLPAYSGSSSKYFPAGIRSVTCHMPEGTTNSRIQQLKATSVFCDFKDIVAGETKVNYTIASDGNARINFVEIINGDDYEQATTKSQLAFSVGTPTSGAVKKDGNYAVEIMDVDPETKDMHLLRNGTAVTPVLYEEQGQPLWYYEDLNLQQGVRYEVSVSDRTCAVSFVQQGYTGRIQYKKTLNGQTTTGVISAETTSLDLARGSQLKLTIPYDPTSYTPNKLYLGGSEVTMTKANGEATATITVPTNLESTQVKLTWQAPEPIVVVVPDPDEPEQTVTEPAHHQPKITIVRSGEGNILLKGLCNLYDEQQSIDAYEREFGYEAQNGWVVNAVANCTGDVTTVTVPDVDYLGRGGYLDMIDWGFKVDITPVAGQTVKSLMMGWIVTDDDNRQYIEWESFSTTGAYLNDDDGDGTFTFSFAGDEMNWWIGDYIVNIAMGPEETAVETGATLNFVRQGGRTEVLFEKEDVDGTLTDQVIGEGSTVYHLKYFTQAELDDAGMSYYQVLWFHPVDGETIHVFCDGTDITSQLVYNTETGNARLDLERKNHTYTLLIDDAPNANPTWTIHNATEGDVIVEQTMKDGTTTTSTYAGNLNDLVIDDASVSKVTLKVYAENANEDKPVRVLKNGQDVSYQFSTMVNDGDGFRLCYEVPVSELTNCSWDISYNTDHAQTFVVKGGTCNLFMEFYYENLNGEPTLDIGPNDGPATVYLPPYDGEYNTYITMQVNADEYEGVTIKRNGIDVTYYFTEKAQNNGKKYYELDINEGNLEDNSTVGLLSFDIREAAVWEIVYKSIDEQETKFSIINHDQLALRTVRSYVTGGAPAIQPISQDHYEFSFNDGDRENTTSLTLKVPIMDANYQYYPVRVLCNGEDVTYQYSDYDSDDGYLIYEVNMRKDQTWDISRDTSHRQTFVRRGGGNSSVEVSFDFPVDGDERYYYPDQIGTPLYVDFPTYNTSFAPYVYIFIDVEDGYTPTVLRNGVLVPLNKFSTESTSQNYTRYKLKEEDYNDNDDGETQERLGFRFRDPAVWEITIDNGTNRFDVNRDGSISIADVTTLVNKILGKE